MRIQKILCVLILMCNTLARGMPPEDWKFRSWADAVAQAKHEKKPIFVLFGFEKCPWCNSLYRSGLNDTTLKLKYQNSLALAYVDTLSHAKDDLFTLPDGNQITHAELIKKYKAYPTPSWIFLSENGDVLLSGRDAKTTSRELLRDLETVLRK